jgi:hypothetical protein
MGFSFRDRVPLSFRNPSSSAFSLPRTDSTGMTDCSLPPPSWQAEQPALH